MSLSRRRYPARRLVLASASKTRRRVLEMAGFDPEVIVSNVDERSIPMASTTQDAVLNLAQHKARAVAPACMDAIVVGCDSMLDVAG